MQSVGIIILSVIIFGICAHLKFPNVEKAAEMTTFFTCKIAIISGVLSYCFFIRSNTMRQYALFGFSIMLFIGIVFLSNSILHQIYDVPGL